MKTKEKELKRKNRVRSKIKGTSERPRLSVFKSNKFIYAQLIDDSKGITIVGISEKHLKKPMLKKIEKAKAMGMLLAEKAKAKKIKKAVFDRGSYLYHGRVSAVAMGAREGGLEF